MAAFILQESLDDHTEQLTISRPDALNALNAQVLDELLVAISALAARADLRAVVLTGAGRAFVAGADIKSMSSMSPEGAEEFGTRGHDVMSAIAALPCPVLAAVNGFALGGGLELALACDLIYASTQAKFGLPEVTLGLIPGFGGTQRLARLIGPHAAREMIFTGQIIPATRAKDLGLVLALFEPDDLLGEVHAIAKTIASRGPRAVRIAKRTVAAGLDLPLKEGLQTEVNAFGHLFDHDEPREGMRAHLEKRSPTF